MNDGDYIFFMAYLNPTYSKIDPLKLNTFIDKLLNRGYKFLNGLAFPFKEPTNTLDVNQLASEINKAIGEKPVNLHLHKFPFEFTFSFSYDQLDTEEDTKWEIAVEPDIIDTKNEFCKANLKEFIEIIQLGLEFFPPVLGYTSLHDIYLSEEKVYQYNINTLYEINYWNKAYTEKILTNIPIKDIKADIIKDIGNGTLLVPDLMELAETLYERMEEVAEQLGLELV